MLQRRFWQVFFVPGNHELWVRPRLVWTQAANNSWFHATHLSGGGSGVWQGLKASPGENLHVRLRCLGAPSVVLPCNRVQQSHPPTSLPFLYAQVTGPPERHGGASDSVQKLQRVLELCRRLGVHTEPRLIGPRLLLAPLHSWHHKASAGRRGVVLQEEGTQRPSAQGSSCLALPCVLACERQRPDAHRRTAALVGPPDRCSSASHPQSFDREPDIPGIPAAGPLTVSVGVAWPWARAEPRLAGQPPSAGAACRTWARKRCLGPGSVPRRPRPKASPSRLGTSRATAMPGATKVGRSAVRIGLAAHLCDGPCSKLTASQPPRRRCPPGRPPAGLRQVPVAPIVQQRVLRALAHASQASGAALLAAHLQDYAKCAGLSRRRGLRATADCSWRAGPTT